jgi:signal transduction histidine kinase/ActR/RegA family two-component response regulator
MISPIDLLVGLGENMALVLVFLGLENQIRLRLPLAHPGLLSLVMGGLFAGIALIGMQVPIHLANGVIVDARVVLVALAGAFYGIPAALVAVNVVAAYRLHLGGLGALSGICAIMGGGAAGAVVFFWVGGRPELLRLKHHLVLGLMLFAWGLVTAFLLPLQMVLDGFLTRILPVPLTYPFAVLFFGNLLGLQMRERAAQADLLAGRERLSLATRTSGLGVWDWEVRTSRLVWDENMGRIYGSAPAASARGFDAWVGLVHPLDRAATTALLAAAVEHGPDQDHTFRICRQDGSIRLIRSCFIGIRDAQGRALRMVGINEDITERTAKDAELTGYRHRLEDLVAIRTGELQRAITEAERARQDAVAALDQAQQLEKSYLSAKESAEQANRAKSDFLASMSHEIRTPLNAVLGYAQMLVRDHRLAPQQRQAVEVINRSGEHLLSLINDVLEMSRIEAGQTTALPEDFDLHGLLDNIKSLFLQRAHEKGLELSVTMAADVPRCIRADQRKLRQVLFNLLSNAIKFTARGCVALMASWQDTQLSVTVSDSGCGISAEDLATLFHPFVQTRSARLGGDGSGLGLALSRGFAKVMGGRLTVESTPGRGSAFTLAIPAIIVDSAIRAAVRRDVIGLVPGQAAPRVLVAEDHAASRALLQEILAQAGCQVVAVDQGQAAIAACREQHIDLILMDIDMPVLDGLSAAAAIRQLPGPAPAIIALTAAAFESDSQRIRAGGCDEIVHKPYREDHLFITIEQLLGIHFVWRERGSESPRLPAAGADGELRNALAALPHEDLGRIREAIIIGDLHAISTQTATWSNRRLADGISELAQACAFDRLHALVAASGGES